MPVIRTQFGGVNTDLPVLRLRSGTADVLPTNVTVSGGRLQKRAGFAAWEEALGAVSVLALFTASFSDGSTYVIAKCSDGVLYRRKVTATAATSFTAITAQQTHDTADPGWAYMWRDDWVYFDSDGSSRWNPNRNSGTARKAGIPKPTTASGRNLAAAAAGGAKEGWYHVWTAYYNSRTQEMGIVAEPSRIAGPTASPVEARLSLSTGGITLTPPATAIPTTVYDCDQYAVFCSLGNTELMEAVGITAETPSWHPYLEVLTSEGSPALSKSDMYLMAEPSRMLLNDGGLPPNTAVGCWTGNVTLYSVVTASPADSKIVYSKRDFPMMVPATESYSYSVTCASSTVTQYETVYPKPFVHEIGSPMPGLVTEMVSAAGGTYVYTATETWKVYGDWRLALAKVSGGAGAVGKNCAVSTGDSAHALGFSTWSVNTPAGQYDIAANRFVGVLDDIPAAYLSASRMAYNADDDQVWCAVAKSGAAVVQRILVWDRRPGIPGEPGALTAFDPANLAADESITAMRRLAFAGAAPTMLVGTNKGRIYQYPSGAADTRASTNYPYAASWRGIFAAESAGYAIRLLNPKVHVGANCNGMVTVTWRTRRTAGDDPTGEATWTAGTAIDRDNALWPLAGAGDKIDGRMFEVQFASAAEAAGSAGTRWTIYDLMMEAERTG